MGNDGPHIVSDFCGSFGAQTAFPLSAVRSTCLERLERQSRLSERPLIGKRKELVPLRVGPSPVT